MKTQLLRWIHRVSLVITVLIMGSVFLLAFVRAEAPVVASELPTVTHFLSEAAGRPVQIGSIQLRWRHLLPVLDLQNVSIQGDTPIQISEIKLGLHFILLKNFTITLSSNTPSLNIDTTGYFNHVILEQAVITMNQYHFRVNRLDLHKRMGGFWSWNGSGVFVDCGKLFLKSIELYHTTGRFHLTFQPSTWEVVVRDMMAENSDIFALVKCDLSGAPQQSPHIYLKAHYEMYPNAVSHLKDYLPQTVLDPDLIHWLTHSIKSVDSVNGSLILQGNLSDFPFDKQPGTFLIDSTIQNATVDYFKGWPRVSHLNAEMIFHNTQLQIHIHSAQIAHDTLENIEVDVPALGKNSVLNISGNLLSTLPNAMYFIDHSPLKESLGKRFSGMKWAGPLGLGLNIQIPLNKLPTRVNGTVNLKNAELTFVEWGIDLKNLTGLISFTEKNFTSPNLTATLMNSPMTISIDKNSAYHIQYKDYKADVIPAKKGGWRINVFNKVFRGVFDVGADPMRNGIKGILSYLNIEPTEMATLVKKDITPSALPPLMLQIRNMRYNSLSFSQLTLQTQRVSQGVVLRNVQLNGPNYSIVGEGKWLDGQQSILDGTLNSNDLAKTVASWGLHPGVQGNSAQATFHVMWPGAIYSPKMSRLLGSVDISIGKGQIDTSGSQAKMDFGRLITLLSFQSLQRRLTLDFSDLTKKGFSFDSITGKMIFNGNGQATLKNMAVRSSIARIDLAGNINLIQKTYALNVTVTPHLTSSLPIVATIAGGPIAGAAVWAASKVVNPLLDKVTEDQYSVTGPWSNPVIKKE